MSRTRDYQAQFANQLYEAGESGMGYHVFTVVFSVETEQAYVTGNAVDFLERRGVTHVHVRIEIPGRQGA